MSKQKFEAQPGGVGNVAKEGEYRRVIVYKERNKNEIVDPVLARVDEGWEVESEMGTQTILRIPKELHESKVQKAAGRFVGYDKPQTDSRGTLPVIAQEVEVVHDAISLLPTMEAEAGAFRDDD